ncbi:NO-inducible flavohemoprotein [Methylobacillus gramineus]|uniref:NO-inducible flavohemoprotein n=1 Tax=Methylobacillus gramineus TaxID=755169 RepID=UPI001CFF5CD8|nr:NO-inducible flavohemoprotein [Methylobacillus gramineus]MCB5185053.1 NO-inducible flavohemoprotein [Methylobacillus gramineus]
MLSATARPYIDASVPVLREHGVDITRVFYQNMLTAHPELKNLFNMGNQANGLQQQSLAAAVFAYAANIDNPAALAPVVTRIVHKHAAVGLKPEHYPIVGEHLLGAIKQVLGDAASDELIAAWGEAYWLLANLLIAEEKSLYQATATQPGQLMALKVARKVQETDQVISFYLQADGKQPGPFKPGQYISVEMQFNQGRGRQLRQYSLSDSTEAPWWRISVKREQENGKPDGQVSHWLHDEVEAGDTLHVTPAFGEFQLHNIQGSGPVILLSAGVGITPMLSMLNTLRDTSPQRPVLFAHATRSPAWQTHGQELQQARLYMPKLETALFYESMEGTLPGLGGIYEGYMDAGALWPAYLQNADIYMCGPLGFMQAQRKSLIAAGVSADRIHREVFGPDMLDHLL